MSTAAPVSTARGGREGCLAQEKLSTRGGVSANTAKYGERMSDRDGVPPILVVDDNAVNRKVAALFVERHGYDVEVAASGPEALEMLAAGQFSLVLLDCQMPGMDGYETAAAIRERHPEPRLPIIAVT